MLMLHPSRWLCSVALVGLLGGCGSTILVGPPPPEDAGASPVDLGSPVDAGFPVVDAGFPVDRPTPIVDAGGRRCTRQSDCARGQQCLGPEGCGVPWTCQVSQGRPCSADVAPFCGCDGVTFGASSTCPDRPYQSRGPCEMPPPPLDGGVAPTACALPDGRLCALGEICSLPERCIQCRCTSRGLQCAMTPCVDGGVMPPPVDAGPATCTIRGVTCRVGEVCLVDRCTACRCDPRGGVSCQTNPACGVDGGPIVVDGGPIGVDVSLPGCAAQDATGQGLCDRLLGIYWQSNRCVAVGGCSCAGADCGDSYPSFEACEMAHVICPRR